MRSFNPNEWCFHYTLYSKLLDSAVLLASRRWVAPGPRVNADKIRRVPPRVCQNMSKPIEGDRSDVSNDLGYDKVESRPLDTLAHQKDPFQVQGSAL